jgi:PleD family two-component response regulator
MTGPYRRFKRPLRVRGIHDFRTGVDNKSYGTLRRDSAPRSGARRSIDGHSDGEPGKLVLVVDDDLGIMNLVFSTLAKRGYRVIGTKTARSAVAIARTVKPDIVLRALQTASSRSGARRSP